ncbi:MAG: 2-dehydropantoate 2-reductase [Kiritimatiellae bacterium]|nr:2-dehydropantoate 2-reductase [Kiritimatiellia bacterium]
MRIYVDFDDVLCETARHLTGLARDMFGRQVAYEAISAFDLRQAFSLSEAEIDELMEHAHRTDFLAGIMPVPGGVEAVDSMTAKGHDLVVVTGRPASSHAGSKAWLRQHGLGWLDLVHVDKYGRADLKTQDGSPRTLGLWEFDAMDFDLAIEDSPAALDILAKRKDCSVIVFDRPWNKAYRHALNMRRAFSWQEIMEMVDGV